MSQNLRIDFRPGEGAVVRLIGLVERRGYCLHGLAMAEEGRLTIQVEPRHAGCRLTSLAAQLSKMPDVRDVHAETLTECRS